MVRPSALSRLGTIAQDQWGLVTRRQAEALRVSRATITRLAADGTTLERVGHGVYRIVGAPLPDHLPLRIAWLQLAPEIPAWERTVAEGIVSHRSAADLYGVGHFPADVYEFTLPTRQRSRRPDVRLHTGRLSDSKWISLRGMPVTRPSRIASDLLREREDPQGVAQLIADAIRNAYDYPGTFAEELAPHAAHFGLRRGDGIALLRWLLDLVGDEATLHWLEEAHASAARAGTGAEQ